MIRFNTLQLKRYFLFFILVFTCFCVIIASCHRDFSQPSIQEQAAEGKILSQKYCASCHVWPSPDLIDRKSWVNGVLPAMAHQLHINTFMGQYFTDKASVMNINDWQNIVTYYKTLAPVNLIIPKPKVAPLNDWAIFSLREPKKVSKVIPAMTTMISYDNHNNTLYTSDAANNLFKWDSNLNSKLVYKFDSPVTGLSYLNEQAIVTCIGTMAPLNQYKGKVYTMKLAAVARPETITDSLPRSVQTVAADFNKDGLTDYVTCGFGHDHGGLYYMEQQPNHSFKKVIVSNIAGGEQLIEGDFNNDGWPDVMCLFAQADEGIRMFLNDHKGGFITQTLLRFPSVYGSSSFQLVDFNHDGKPDILYTCGDNSDYSKVLKPYHGVYIFTNQGNWKFKQTYFYQINGCTKAMANDFTHCGKLDVAVIAFFADFKDHPLEGLTYLEQTTPGNFIAHEIPVNNYGRWLTMDVADLDHDGYDDIILGNFSTPGRGLINQKGLIPKWDQHVPIIVLKNNASKLAK